jgi:hypothetical protein
MMNEINMSNLMNKHQRDKPQKSDRAQYVHGLQKHYHKNWESNPNLHDISPSSQLQNQEEEHRFLNENYS